jgi:hypothetical protein
MLWVTSYLIFVFIEGLVQVTASRRGQSPIGVIGAVGELTGQLTSTSLARILAACIAAAVVTIQIKRWQFAHIHLASPVYGIIYSAQTISCIFNINIFISNMSKCNF